MNKKVKLLKIESNTVLYCQSISTMTIYEGISPNNYIIKKIKKIIIQNPWLNGKLTKSDEKIFLEYNDNYTDNIEYIYNYIENNELVFDLFIKNPNVNNYNKIINQISSFLVKSGIECLNKDEKLFKVILIKLIDNKFALIISINHCIVDGYTYYKLYNMFSESIIEEKMIVERINNFDDIIKKNKSWQSNIGKYLFFLFNFIRKTKPLNLYIIEKNKFNNLKEEYKNKNILISTNDIITSEFFNKSKTLIGLMNFNYRNLNINKYKLLSGNYIDTIYFNKKIYNPYIIRHELNLYKLNKNTNDVNNTFYNKIYNYIYNIYNNIINIRNMFSLSCISSWDSLYKELIIQNSKKIIHIPCIINLNSSIYFNNFCMVFHYTNNKIGILSNINNLNY